MSCGPPPSPATRESSQARTVGGCVSSGWGRAGLRGAHPLTHTRWLLGTPTTSLHCVETPALSVTPRSSSSSELLHLGLSDRKAKDGPAPRSDALSRQSGGVCARPVRVASVTGAGPVPGRALPGDSPLGAPVPLLPTAPRGAPGAPVLGSEPACPLLTRRRPLRAERPPGPRACPATGALSPIREAPTVRRARQSLGRGPPPGADNQNAPWTFPIPFTFKGKENE